MVRATVENPNGRHQCAATTLRGRRCRNMIGGYRVRLCRIHARGKPESEWLLPVQTMPADFDPARWG